MLTTNVHLKYLKTLENVKMLLFTIVILKSVVGSFVGFLLFNCFANCEFFTFGQMSEL